MTARLLLPLVALGLALTACASPPEPRGTAPAEPAYDAVLHDELVAMAARDQEQLTGVEVSETPEARTARLGEILDDVGWPTISLVGDDGEDAAWLIAQHSDLDLAFQKRALGLLRTAVGADDGSPGNLAYLEDRVAVAEGRPQTYGTQITCGPEGPVPRTPIRDPDGVEERRAEAGIESLAAYTAEMTKVCASDG